MKLVVISAMKDWTGLIDVTVRVNGKKDYTFTLSSQFDLDEFERIVEHNPGKALNWLKQVKVKENKEI
jgi:hypothetical protein